MLAHDVIEYRRQEIQRQIDATKTKLERNRLGQFATPMELASDIMAFAETLLESQEQIRFFDPALGTGSFLSALYRTFPDSQIASITGYEIDQFYGAKALELWGNKGLNLYLADFTRAKIPIVESRKPNLLICNPPYVRHHHLQGGEKQRLQRLAGASAGIQLSELSGLYCYFLFIAHQWMKENSLAGWLIPSEFMDVNYGRQVKKYLLERVTLLRIHRFDPADVQFKDALVSSAVVWFKKAPPPPNHSAEFTFGGSLISPKVMERVSLEVLRSAAKWTRFPSTHHLMAILPARNHLNLSDFFHIKRGIATGANDFFILTQEQVTRYELPTKFLTPILPSPRYLNVDEIHVDSNGNPLISPRLFLLTCSMGEEEIKAYPTLWKYLQMGIEIGLDKRYLCTHRSPWYLQENRTASTFLCTYMGRQVTENGSPFRFILNHSNAVAANVYLMMYPKPRLNELLKDRPSLKHAIWQALRTISPKALMSEGRVYGGGLYKLEPKELANAPADCMLEVLPEWFSNHTEQMSLF